MFYKPPLKKLGANKINSETYQTAQTAWLFTIFMTFGKFGNLKWQQIFLSWCSQKKYTIIISMKKISIDFMSDVLVHLESKNSALVHSHPPINSTSLSLISDCCAIRCTNQSLFITARIVLSMALTCEHTSPNPALQTNV